MTDPTDESLIDDPERVERRSGVPADAPLSSQTPGSKRETLPSVVPSGREIARAGLFELPEMVVATGPSGVRRFLEFFTATIRNRNTRVAYAKAVSLFFTWCDERGLTRLDQIEPMTVAAYIETHEGAAPTVKQHLAALRMLFDWLVTGHVMNVNPAIV